MARPLYRPTPQQALWLGAVAAGALGAAFYIRYSVIEPSAVGLACEAGASTLLCAGRRMVIALFGPSVFGIVAIGAALLNLLRPNVVLATVALLAAGLGLVLYNTTLAGFGVGILLLSLARPAPEPE